MKRTEENSIQTLNRVTDGKATSDQKSSAMAAEWLNIDTSDWLDADYVANLAEATKDYRKYTVTAMIDGVKKEKTVYARPGTEQDIAKETVTNCFDLADKIEITSIVENQ